MGVQSAEIRWRCSCGIVLPVERGDPEVKCFCGKVTKFSQDAAAAGASKTPARAVASSYVVPAPAAVPAPPRQLAPSPKAVAPPRQAPTPPPAERPVIVSTPRRRAKKFKNAQQPGFWECLQTGELSSGALFRLTYGALGPLTTLPAVVCSLVVVLSVLLGVGAFLFQGVNLAIPIVLFIAALSFVILISSWSWHLLARPIWHARLRYFHNRSFASVTVLRMGPGIGDRVGGLLTVRDFLLSLPRSGRHFQTRWSQNHSLFVAYAVVHQSVRRTRGQLPSVAEISAEYRMVMNALQSQYPFLSQFNAAVMNDILGEVIAYYDRRGDEAHTFLAIGDLVQAVSRIRRRKIYPYLVGNRLEHDLGLLLDGIFDQCMIAEDRLLDSHQFHSTHGGDVQHLLWNNEFALHLMQLEHPLLTTYTRFTIWLIGGARLLPEMEK